MFMYNLLWMLIKGNDWLQKTLAEESIHVTGVFWWHFVEKTYIHSSEYCHKQRKDKNLYCYYLNWGRIIFLCYPNHLHFFPLHQSLYLFPLFITLLHMVGWAFVLFCHLISHCFEEKSSFQAMHIVDHGNLSTTVFLWLPLCCIMPINQIWSEFFYNF